MNSGRITIATSTGSIRELSGVDPGQIDVRVLVIFASLVASFVSRVEEPCAIFDGSHRCVSLKLAHCKEVAKEVENVRWSSFERRATMKGRVVMRRATPSETILEP